MTYEVNDNVETMTASFSWVLKGGSEREGRIEIIEEDRYITTRGGAVYTYDFIMEGQVMRISGYSGEVWTLSKQ